MKVRGRITCGSSYVLNLLKCPCGFCFVGKTSRGLRIRISEHKSIRNWDEKSPVARHLNSAGHRVYSQRFMGVEAVKPLLRGGGRERKLDSSITDRVSWGLKWGITSVLFFMNARGIRGYSQYGCWYFLCRFFVVDRHLHIHAYIPLKPDLCFCV